MRTLLFVLVFGYLLPIQGQSQSKSGVGLVDYAYHPRSHDKISWQRLNLWIAALHYCSVSSGISVDSGLTYASRTLGLSRLLVCAEGIDDTAFLAQSDWFDKRAPGTGRVLLSQAKGKQRVQLLILLGAYYNFEHKSYKRFKDSIEYFLKTAIRESRALQENKLGRVASCLLIKLYGDGFDWANGDAVMNQLTRECEKAGDKDTYARALVYRGTYQAPRAGTNGPPSYADHGKDWIGYFRQAAAIYHEIQDRENESAVWYQKGYYNIAIGNDPEAYADFAKAMQLQQEVGYPYTHYATGDLGMMGIFLGKFGEPLKYFLEAIRTAELTKDSIPLSGFYSRLGLLYQMEDPNQEKALVLFRKSLNLLVAARHSNSFESLYDLLIVMNARGGRAEEAMALALYVSKTVPATQPDHFISRDLSFAICYLGRKQYEQAEQFVRSADSIANTYPKGYPFGDSQRRLVSETLNMIHFASGAYSKAREYLLQALEDTTRVIILGMEIEKYKRLILIDSVFHDDVSAVKHYKQYLALVDSNFKVSKIRQAEEFQVTYQTREKEDEIMVLNQQSKLEQANTSQATLVRNVTIAGALGILIIAGLLYRQSQSRKASNQIINDKNHQLQTLVSEKELLLKEVHHRVKNNLHTVIGLLESQAAYLEDDALKANEISKHRIFAMSLIHQQLYQSEDIKTINMSVYLPELLNYLADSFGADRRIRFQHEIEPLQLGVSQAIPIGLIVNEAVTNALKYAFPHNKKGVIRISLQQMVEEIELIVADDGIGVQPAILNAPSSSMGLKLMRGLTADIQGEIDIAHDHGTIIRIRFLPDQIHSFTAQSNKS